MKIVAINGSPRKNGNTAQLLEVVRREVEAAGVEFQVFQPGPKVRPCMACYHCLNTGSLRCVQTDDMVNDIIAACIEADGILLASPVYHGGIAGGMKAKSLDEEEKKKAVRDFNFPKGIAVALLCGLMSACFAIGIDMGKDICFEETPEMFRTLPATFLVTLGGFFTNLVYCLFQNAKNGTFGDYGKGSVWLNNAVFCCLAGVLWYSQFFGLSLGKGFLVDSPTLLTFSWCILMALNVTFSNVWGIILKEWKGTTKATKTVLVAGIVILIVSSFLPQLL